VKAPNTGGMRPAWMSTRPLSSGLIRTYHAYGVTPTPVSARISVRNAMRSVARASIVTPARSLRIALVS
jgi:hypothetical protein